jgi:hypothetical protein
VRGSGEQFRGKVVEPHGRRDRVLSEMLAQKADNAANGPQGDLKERRSSPCCRVKIARADRRPRIVNQHCLGVYVDWASAALSISPRYRDNCEVFILSKRLYGLEERFSRSIALSGAK